MEETITHVWFLGWPFVLLALGITVNLFAHAYLAYKKAKSFG